MLKRISVAILDNHQSIIDGYVYRLSGNPDIQIVATGIYGEELEPMLESHRVDVLLSDIYVKTSEINPKIFPLVHVLPRLRQVYSDLRIMIISSQVNRKLVEELVGVGIRGYIFKEDTASIQQLGQIITCTARGGVFFSQGAYSSLHECTSKPVLTPRQLEVLTLCAANPDSPTCELAKKLKITGSTLRNLLSGAYNHLGVQTRAAAISRAQQLGILPEISRIFENLEQELAHSH